MAAKYGNLFRGLEKKELIAHKLEALIAANKIPTKVLVDNPTHDSESDDYFHPSMHTSMHARQLYFNFHPEYKKKLIKRERFYKDVIVPYMGTTGHAIIQGTLIENGIVPASDVEISLVNEEHHWRGHMDFLYKGIPVDIKTMNPAAFSRLTDDWVPYQKYQEQLNCYMDMYPDAPYGVLLFFEMGYPFRIREYTVKRDTEMLEKIYKKWDYVRESIELDQPPSICCALQGPEFNACAARIICTEVD